MRITCRIANPVCRETGISGSNPDLSADSERNKYRTKQSGTFARLDATRRRAVGRVRPRARKIPVHKGVRPGRASPRGNDRHGITIEAKASVEQCRAEFTHSAVVPFTRSPGRRTSPCFLASSLSIEIGPVPPKSRTLRHGTGQGTAFQIPEAYSAIVRSLENFPDPAMFKMVLRSQFARSVYSFVSRESAVKYEERSARCR
jgi:hypothetical protein